MALCRNVWLPTWARRDGDPEKVKVLWDIIKRGNFGKDVPRIEHAAVRLEYAFIYNVSAEAMRRAAAPYARKAMDRADRVVAYHHQGSTILVLHNIDTDIKEAPLHQRLKWAKRPDTVQFDFARLHTKDDNTTSFIIQNDGEVTNEASIEGRTMVRNKDHVNEITARLPKEYRCGNGGWAVQMNRVLLDDFPAIVVRYPRPGLVAQTAKKLYAAGKEVLVTSSFAPAALRGQGRSDRLLQRPHVGAPKPPTADMRATGPEACEGPCQLVRSDLQGRRDEASPERAR
ncbi:MAG: hypothetical protein HC927_04660 [Deltaproteobacteria bacterium]|nr:hypothetical protein [Deltaproteobacteria bacterium]